MIIIDLFFLISYVHDWGNGVMAELHATSRGPKRIKKDLEEAHIVPQIIATAPYKAVQIIYPTHEAHFGTIIGPSYARNKPKIKFPADEDEFYSLVMLSPDDDRLPENSTYQWLHWLVVNIKGSDVPNGETIAPYYGPFPEADLKFYRYVFIVFMQPLDYPATFLEARNTDIDDVYRGNFRAKRFQEKYNLFPIAANFFHSEYVEWSPVTQAPLHANGTTKDPHNPFL